MAPAASSRSLATRLALLNVFTAGAGLGYLAREYREVVVANPAAIGLVLLFVLAFGYVVRAVVRALRRAGSRVDSIFAEELGNKPSPRPR
ncbi:hypothetical protein Q5425_29160 [Amycolatopsis sp. A133]|uniref:hypothetical protein n=1 Tax=Amycolatopsis sp. A133 TaxID=3064472 RepID=UPI0027EA746B|nr:hypothetical protein [Amycolatopsis sp. A133]MDQ7807825.1 hypothetical protein [Amycolatopsis sp. A133]